MQGPAVGVVSSGVEGGPEGQGVEGPVTGKQWQVHNQKGIDVETNRKYQADTVP